MLQYRGAERGEPRERLHQLRTEFCRAETATDTSDAEHRLVCMPLERLLIGNADQSHAGEPHPVQLVEGVRRASEVTSVEGNDRARAQIHSLVLTSVGARLALQFLRQGRPEQELDRARSAEDP